MTEMINVFKIHYCPPPFSGQNFNWGRGMSLRQRWWWGAMGLGVGWTLFPGQLHAGPQPACDHASRILVAVSSPQMVVLQIALVRSGGLTILWPPAPKPQVSATVQCVHVPWHPATPLPSLFLQRCVSFLRPVPYAVDRFARGITGVPDMECKAELHPDVVRGVDVHFALARHQRRHSSRRQVLCT